MTLKKKLSTDRKKAILEKLQQKALADEEMRKIIKDCINPIIELMHQEYRTEKNLSVTMEEGTNCICFFPKFDIDYNRCKGQYNTSYPYNELVAAAIRIGSEFDLIVKKDKKLNLCYFTMVLDD